MNLIELYDKLPFPKEGSGKVFSATPIPEYPGFRIAVNVDGHPVLLLSVTNAGKGTTLKNFRLKYLQLEHGVECKILENGKVSFETFTVVIFTSDDRNLQEYFLRIAETLVKALSNRPTQQQVVDSLNKFVEVFRSLVDTPTNTIHGLWTELFLIDISSDPKTLLNYWHSIPEERFDFNSGAEKIEVKSNSNFERIHTFSSEQLNPPAGTAVLVASVFIRQNTNGQSIQQLVESITSLIASDIELIEKLNSIVFKTLGNSLEQSVKIKFDINIARESLRYYWQHDISKIEKMHIPDKVSEVRYRSDLTELKSVDKSDLKNTGELFRAI